MSGESLEILSTTWLFSVVQGWKRYLPCPTITRGEHFMPQNKSWNKKFQTEETSQTRPPDANCSLISVPDTGLSAGFKLSFPFNLWMQRPDEFSGPNRAPDDAVGFPGCRMPAGARVTVTTLSTKNSFLCSCSESEPFFAMWWEVTFTYFFLLLYFRKGWVSVWSLKVGWRPPVSHKGILPVCQSCLGIYINTSPRYLLQINYTSICKNPV